MADLDPIFARRVRLTRSFLGASLPPPARLFDLGTDNPMARQLRSDGYEVLNTGGEDLDDVPEVASGDADAVTAFEILEHLVNPLGVLRAIRAPRLFASVPLRLWFASAYRNPSDPWDRHYHEFEDWQFDWLLDKAGWDIVRTERWTNPATHYPIGIRPILRRFVPRWYMVEARRRV